MTLVHGWLIDGRWLISLFDLDSWSDLGHLCLLQVEWRCENKSTGNQIDLRPLGKTPLTQWTELVIHLSILFDTFRSPSSSEIKEFIVSSWFVLSIHLSMFCELVLSHSGGLGAVHDVPPQKLEESASASGSGGNLQFNSYSHWCMKQITWCEIWNEIVFSFKRFHPNQASLIFNWGIGGCGDNESMVMMMMMMMMMIWWYDEMVIDDMMIWWWWCSSGDVCCWWFWFWWWLIELIDEVSFFSDGFDLFGTLTWQSPMARPQRYTKTWQRRNRWWPQQLVKSFGGRGVYGS